ncbi:hypothetical protein RI129_012682 [Pyrocoelia pectoralis]|uniref:DNA-directed DNA polymerase n=1 Tax=Pyrocoelia pectoralis TaxID=417401 RepID=A0AAN7ZCA8_9COLE
MALSKLPKVFGLTEIRKGYFPHLFNTTDHQNYIGPIPPLETFEPDNLKCNDREALLAWYEGKVAENYIFDFKKEFVEYCVSDVDILAQACLKFRQLMIKEGNVCPFTESVTLPNEMLNYTESHPLTLYLPLNPRDAFYGGRTGNAKSFYKTKEGEKIKYVDFTSLYPYVNKYGKYPLGHPTVHIGEECSKLNLETTDGLIKCKILPPHLLFHPVLPVKMNNKLMFVLCRSCGESFNQEPCEHISDDERALTGTWVIDEVRKAIEKGYKILETYEIWQYIIDQYNKDTKTGGLFNEYINKFVGIKQQSSGWPYYCDTPKKKDNYIKEYFEAEGVRLDPVKIERNPGLRQLGKAVITSFWGKLGQRENQSKTSIVREPGEFYNMMTNPSININSVLPINEDALLVNWESKEEAYSPLSTVNVVLAAYTTAQARLKLYEHLERLEERVIYYDTDSIIYVSAPEQYDPPLGQFLGELTDELEDEGAGSYIKEFVSGGPKNYAYKAWSTSKECDVTVCKVKGISLTYKTSQIINFDKIMKMNGAHPHVPKVDEHLDSEKGVVQTSAGKVEDNLVVNSNANEKPEVFEMYDSQAVTEKKIPQEPTSSYV